MRRRAQTKRNPAEGRDSQTLLGSVSLFPPREAFHGKRQIKNSGCAALLKMVRPRNWPPLNRPPKLLLPLRSPELAALLEVVALLKLFLADVAHHKGVAVPVGAIGEVVAGDADHTTFPTL